MPETSSPDYSPDAHFNGIWSATPLTVVVCCSIAGYNAIEGFLLIFSTFRQYKSLYFRSLIMATVGILFYMVALILWYFALSNRLVALVLLYVGWICMVSGQSVVLYSRLGLVMGAERENIVRMVKYMIITNGIIFHTTTIGASMPASIVLNCVIDTSIVVSVCSFYAPDPRPASNAYRYVERVQITAFGLQELVISGIYIWRTADILRTMVHQRHRRIIIELMLVNFILVIIDIATVTLEYCNLFFFEVAFKLLSYSVKLKLEFAILSKLMVLSGGDESTRASRSDSLAFQTEIPPSAANMYTVTESKSTC